MKTVKVSALITGGMLSLTSICGLVLASSYTHADDNSVTDDVSITVPVACTMTGTINTAHNATLNPGTWSGASDSDYENGIGKTTLTTFCNDYNGFSIYAIGYTGDTDGNNTLVGTSASGGATIPTKVYESTDTSSNWSMKVTKVTDSSASYNPENMTIATDTEGIFSSWHTVPSTYTKVAEYKATTGSSATDTTLGAKVETTYASYISTSQPADTYTGKVKYTMVHPYDHAAPVIQPTPPTSCNTPVPGATYMQDVNSSIISGLTKGNAYYLRDNRDEKPYCVSKLEDGKLWMLDNLALDLANSTVLNGMNENNTNASNTTLGYLKNGGGTTSDQWPTSGVSYWTSTLYSYSAPWIAIKNASDESWNPDTTTTSYGDGSGKIGIYYNYCAASAGTYCWGNGTSDFGSPSSDPKTSSLYDIDGDICPKGWHLPTITSGGEYENLYNAYSSAPEGQAAAFMSALSTPLSGSFNKGSAHDQGSSGSFWSSTWYTTISMRLLNANSSYVERSSLDYRYYGDSVRCVQGSA